MAEVLGKEDVKAETKFAGTGAVCSNSLVGWYGKAKNQDFLDVFVADDKMDGKEDELGESGRPQRPPKICTRCSIT